MSNPDDQSMASNTSPADEARRWIEAASAHAAELKQTLTSAADSATAAAGSALTRFLSSSTAFIHETKGTVELAKNEYAVYEDLAVAKIKEGILVAASHPELASGIVAGLGLVVLKRPRRFLIRKTRSLFMSEESLLSDAEAKMSKVRQSVNLVQNESRKLEERALKAEQEMKRGREALIKEGREIRGELRFINRIEKETTGLKELMRELPRRETSRFRSEISSLASQLNQEKKALTSTASRIINKGISI